MYGRKRAFAGVLLVLVLVTALVGLASYPVYAESGPDPAVTPEVVTGEMVAVQPAEAAAGDLSGLVTGFLSLAGAAGLIAALVNAGKAAGLVQDGKAGMWSLGLNLVGLVTLYIVGLVKPDFDIGQADAVAGSLAQILTLVLALLSQLGISKLAHLSIKGLPLIGTSYSSKSSPAAG
jgi:hypothetical protein